MPLFKYQALSAEGKQSRGTLEAPTTDNALEVLSKKGLTVFSLEAITSNSATRAGNSSKISLTQIGRQEQHHKNISQEELLVCVQELSTLLNAGIPLADALLNIAQGHESRPIGASLHATYKNLRSGLNLASSLKESGLKLPDYVHELVRAGEETGKLGASIQ